MKIMHPPVGQGVVTALHDIFAGGYPADKVIQRQLKMHRKWGSSDRRLFAECVYDIVRWWRRILYATNDV
jgi:16S rRNA (cytosine967-C5)-methyltransferase